MNMKMIAVTVVIVPLADCCIPDNFHEEE